MSSQIPIASKTEDLNFVFATLGIETSLSSLDKAEKKTQGSVSQKVWNYLENFTKEVFTEEHRNLRSVPQEIFQVLFNLLQDSENIENIIEFPIPLKAVLCANFDSTSSHSEICLAALQVNWIRSLLMLFLGIYAVRLIYFQDSGNAEKILFALLTKFRQFLQNLVELFSSLYSKLYDKQGSTPLESVGNILRSTISDEAVLNNIFMINKDLLRNKLIALTEASYNQLSSTVLSIVSFYSKNEISEKLTSDLDQFLTEIDSDLNFFASNAAEKKITEFEFFRKYCRLYVARWFLRNISLWSLDLINEDKKKLDPKKIVLFFLPLFLGVYDIMKNNDLLSDCACKIKLICEEVSQYSEKKSLVESDSKIFLNDFKDAILQGFLMNCLQPSDNIFKYYRSEIKRESVEKLTHHKKTDVELLKKKDSYLEEEAQTLAHTPEIVGLTRSDLNSISSTLPRYNSFANMPLNARKVKLEILSVTSIMDGRFLVVIANQPQLTTKVISYFLSERSTLEYKNMLSVFSTVVIYDTKNSLKNDNAECLLKYAPVAVLPLVTRKRWKFFLPMHQESKKKKKREFFDGYVSSAEDEIFHAKKTASTEYSIDEIKYYCSLSHSIIQKLPGNSDYENLYGYSSSSESVDSELKISPWGCCSKIYTNSSQGYSSYAYEMGNGLQHDTSHVLAIAAGPFQISDQNNLSNETRSSVDKDNYLYMPAKICIYDLSIIDSMLLKQNVKNEIKKLNYDNSRELMLLFPVASHRPHAFTNSSIDYEPKGFSFPSSCGENSLDSLDANASAQRMLSSSAFGPGSLFFEPMDPFSLDSFESFLSDFQKDGALFHAETKFEGLPHGHKLNKNNTYSEGNSSTSSDIFRGTHKALSDNCGDENAKFKLFRDLIERDFSHSALLRQNLIIHKSLKPKKTLTMFSERKLSNFHSIKESRPKIVDFTEKLMRSVVNSAGKKKWPVFANGDLRGITNLENVIDDVFFPCIDGIALIFDRGVNISSIAEAFFNTSSLEGMYDFLPAQHNQKGLNGTANASSPESGIAPGVVNLHLAVASRGLSISDVTNEAIAQLGIFWNCIYPFGKAGCARGSFANIFLLQAVSLSSFELLRFLPLTGVILQRIILVTPCNTLTVSSLTQSIVVAPKGGGGGSTATRSNCTLFSFFNYFHTNYIEIAVQQRRKRKVEAASRAAVFSGNTRRARSAGTTQRVTLQASPAHSPSADIADEPIDFAQQLGVERATLGGTKSVMPAAREPRLALNSIFLDWSNPRGVGGISRRRENFTIPSNNYYYYMDEQEAAETLTTEWDKYHSLNTKPGVEEGPVGRLSEGEEKPFFEDDTHICVTAGTSSAPHKRFKVPEHGRAGTKRGRNKSGGRHAQPLACLCVDEDVTSTMDGIGQGGSLQGSRHLSMNLTRHSRKQCEERSTRLDTAPLPDPDDALELKNLDSFGSVKSGSDAVVELVSEHARDWALAGGTSTIDSRFSGNRHTRCVPTILSSEGSHFFEDNYKHAKYMSETIYRDPSWNNGFHFKLSQSLSLNKYYHIFLHQSADLLFTPSTNGSALADHLKPLQLQRAGRQGEQHHVDPASDCVDVGRGVQHSLKIPMIPTPCIVTHSETEKDRCVFSCHPFSEKDDTFAHTGGNSKPQIRWLLPEETRRGQQRIQRYRFLLGSYFQKLCSKYCSGPAVITALHAAWAYEHCTDYNSYKASPSHSLFLNNEANIALVPEPGSIEDRDLKSESWMTYETSTDNLDGANVKGKSGNGFFSQGFTRGLWRRWTIGRNIIAALLNYGSTAGGGGGGTGRSKSHDSSENFCRASSGARKGESEYETYGGSPSHLSFAATQRPLRNVMCEFNYHYCFYSPQRGKETISRMLRPQDVADHAQHAAITRHYKSTVLAYDPAISLCLSFPVFFSNNQELLSSLLFERSQLSVPISNGEAGTHDGIFDDSAQEALATTDMDELGAPSEVIGSINYRSKVIGNYIASALTEWSILTVSASTTRMLLHKGPSYSRTPCENSYRDGIFTQGNSNVCKPRTSQTFTFSTKESDSHLVNNPDSGLLPVPSIAHGRYITLTVLCPSHRKIITNNNIDTTVFSPSDEQSNIESRNSGLTHLSALFSRGYYAVVTIDLLYGTVLSVAPLCDTLPSLKHEAFKQMLRKELAAADANADAILAARTKNLKNVSALRRRLFVRKQNYDSDHERDPQSGSSTPSYEVTELFQGAHNSNKKTSLEDFISSSSSSDGEYQQSSEKDTTKERIFVPAERLFELPVALTEIIEVPNEGPLFHDEMGENSLTSMIKRLQLIDPVNRSIAVSSPPYGLAGQRITTTPGFLPETPLTATAALMLSDAASTMSLRTAVLILSGAHPLLTATASNAASNLELTSAFEYAASTANPSSDNANVSPLKSSLLVVCGMLDDTVCIVDGHSGTRVATLDTLYFADANSKGVPKWAKNMVYSAKSAPSRDSLTISCSSSLNSKETDVVKKNATSDTLSNESDSIKKQNGTAQKKDEVVNLSSSSLHLIQQHRPYSNNSTAPPNLYINVLDRLLARGVAVARMGSEGKLPQLSVAEGETRHAENCAPVVKCLDSTEAEAIAKTVFCAFANAEDMSVLMDAETLKSLELRIPEWVTTCTIRPSQGPLLAVITALMKVLSCRHSGMEEVLSAARIFAHAICAPLAAPTPSWPLGQGEWAEAAGCCLLLEMQNGRVSDPLKEDGVTDKGDNMITLDEIAGSSSKSRTCPKEAVTQAAAASTSDLTTASTLTNGDEKKYILSGAPEREDLLPYCDLHYLKHTHAPHGVINSVSIGVVIAHKNSTNGTSRYSATDSASGLDIAKRHNRTSSEGIEGECQQLAVFAAAERGYTLMWKL